MAKYRQVHTSYWQDAFVLDLTPEEKYFYIYLMTNSKTTQCGIYEIPKKVMEMETGYNRETVDKLIQRFIDYGKIVYSQTTNEIALLNWPKYNSIASPKVEKCIQTELEAVKDRALIPYLYGNDTPSIDYGEEEEKEEEQEEEREEESTYTPKALLDHWNSQNVIQHRKLSDKTRRSIQSAFKTYSPEELQQAITNYAQILHDPLYYWTHKWTLKEFLERGIDKFLDWDTASGNFQVNKKESPKKNRQDPDYLTKLRLANRAIDEMEGNHET